MLLRSPAFWLSILIGLGPAAPAAAVPGQVLQKQVTEHVASLPPSRLKAMLEKALSYLSVPYQWGGDDAKADGGFDCVGLAYSLYHAYGLEFPFARFSSLNMTAKPRSAAIPKLWWTAYVEDFAQTMQDCSNDLAFKDGDVLVYHQLLNGHIGERTGHAVLVMDAKRGYAMSAARAGVSLHSLGDLRTFANKTLTACWRAASALKPPVPAVSYTWAVAAGSANTSRQGTHKDPFRTTNPLHVTLTAMGPELQDLRFDLTGRVLSLIAAVNPAVKELPAPPGSRQWDIQHDFKAVDLPVDPGEKVPTPQRKLVARLFNKEGLMLSEKVFYVEFRPYW